MPKTPVSESLLIKLQAEACNFIKKETLAQVFSCEFCEFLRTPFCIEHLWTIASGFIQRRLDYTDVHFKYSSRISSHDRDTDSYFNRLKLRNRFRSFCTESKSLLNCQRKWEFSKYKVQKFSIKVNGSVYIVSRTDQFCLPYAII